MKKHKTISNKVNSNFLKLLIILFVSCKSVYDKVPEKNADIYSKDATTVTKVFETGIEEMSKLIEKDSLNSKAYSLRAYYYFMLRKGRESLSDYNRAIMLNPSFTNYIERSLLFSRIRNNKKSIEDLNKAKSLYLKTPNKSLKFGQYYMALGKYDQALKYLEKAKNEKNEKSKIPTKYTLFLNIAECYNKLGKFENAIMYLRKAEKQYSKSPNLYSDMGLNYEHLEKTDDAITYYTKAIKIDPEYFIPIYNRGNVFFDTEKYDEAIKDYETSLKLTPRKDYLTIVNTNLSRLFFLKKEYLKSIEYGNRVVLFQNKPNKFYSISRYTMAISNLKLGNQKIAYDLYYDSFKNGGLLNQTELIEQVEEDLINHYKEGNNKKMIKKIFKDILKNTEDEFEIFLQKY